MHKTESAVPRDLQNAPNSLFSIIPLVPSAHTTAITDRSHTYKPEFFNESEWALLKAACECLTAHANLDTSESLVDLPVFIDQHMLSPYAHGDLDCLQDPFTDTPAKLPKGRQPIRDLVRAGLADLNRYSQQTHQQLFTALSAEEQQQVLNNAEAGLLGTQAQEFIALLRTEIDHSRFAHSLFPAYESLSA
jgi:gluconate 2-dehydrogenase gamma chain